MVGERLKLLRKQKGWTQAKLAKRLNVEPSAVGKWEIYNATPSAETLKKIAIIFHVSTDYLLGLDQHAKLPANTIQITNSEGVSQNYSLTSKETEVLSNLITLIKEKEEQTSVALQAS